MKGTSVDTRAVGKPGVQLQDVWDWAYCPLLVWWRTNGIPKRVAHSATVTGESLVRRSVRTALEAYYRMSHSGSGKTISPSRALGFVWRSWMEEWGLGDELIRDLLEYQERRREVLDRIEGDVDSGVARAGWRHGAAGNARPH
jgi:hypothetical protein